MRVKCFAMLVLHAASDVAAILELTETSFDVLLREVPVAMVAYVNPATDVHYPGLQPALRALGDAYAHAGIGVGRVSSEHTELLDRFQVDAFPTLHWMDGSKSAFEYGFQQRPVH